MLSIKKNITTGKNLQNRNNTLVLGDTSAGNQAPPYLPPMPHPPATNTDFPDSFPGTNPAK